MNIMTEQHPPGPNEHRHNAHDAALAWAMSLLSAIGEGVGVVSRDGRLLWANDLLNAWGPALSARIGEIARESAPILLDQRGESAATGEEGPARRVIIVPVDGREYELELSAMERAGVKSFSAGATYASGVGGVAAMAVVVRDVSAQRSLRRRLDAIDMAGGELVNLDADSVRKLNAHERLKFLEKKIIRSARDLLNFDHFAIRLLDDRSGKLELVMGHGLPPEYDLFDIYPRLEGCGISGYVAATGRSMICEDVSKSTLFLPGVSGAKSSLTVPLKLQDRVIGIMNVESLRDKAFADDDRQLAEMFARYLAMALHTLDLLVVERSTTNQSVSGRVAGELDEPLRDILSVVDALREAATGQAGSAAAIDRIRRDVESIRERVQACAAGPTTLLGVEKAMSERETDPLLAGKRVLVADDEPKIRQIITEVLRHRGCEVVVCENGGVAIQHLDEAARTHATFDLIVSDIRMPDRNGYEVFSAARRIFNTIPVILMTGFGYDPHHSIVRASQEGLQAVLFKPFQVERLIEEVRKALSPRS